MISSSLSKTLRNIMESQHVSEDVDMVLYVTNEAQDVSINMNSISEIAEKVLAYMKHNYDIRNFGEVAFGRYVRLSSEFHPKPDDHEAADWLFVLNTLNFALWTPKNEQEWRVNELTGYMALCAAIKRAIDDGKPMWDPRFYTNLSMADMKHIFRGDDNNVIPGIFQRLELLHDVGEILLTRYKGTFAECIRSCQGDAIKLVATLLNFPSYDDKIRYGEKLVILCNKAWILVTDIESFFDSKHELGIKMTKMKFPTIFADYRVPQVLHHFNALVYSKTFLEKFEKNDELLTHGSKEELEIRCCSLMIVKYVHEKMMEKCENYVKFIPELQLPIFDGICLIDNFLWDYRQIHNEQLKKSLLCKVFTDQY